MPEFIELSRLMPHPKQVETYESKIDDVFIESVKTRGVLQPLLIAPVANIFSNPKDFPSFHGYEFNGFDHIIISGFRRSCAAKEAGFTTVPYEIKEYENEDEMLTDFLESNRHRNKTGKEKKNEFLHYKQLLCQVEKVRKATKTSADTKNRYDSILRILKKLDLDPDETLNSMDVIEKKTGMSKHEQRLNNVVYSDEYYESALAKFRELAEHNNKEFTSEAETAIWDKWQEVRAAVEDEEYSLNAGHDRIKELCKTVEKQLKGKGEKKEKKAAKSKGKKEKGGVGIDKLFVKTAKFHDFEEYQHEVYYDGVGFGFIKDKTTGKPVSIAFTLNDAFYKINIRLLTEMLIKEANNS